MSKLEVRLRKEMLAGKGPLVIKKETDFALVVLNWNNGEWAPSEWRFNGSGWGEGKGPVLHKVLTPPVDPLTGRTAELVEVEAWQIPNSEERSLPTLLCATWNAIAWSRCDSNKTIKTWVLVWFKNNRDTRRAWEIGNRDPKFWAQFQRAKQLHAG